MLLGLIPCHLSLERNTGAVPPLSRAKIGTNPWIRNERGSQKTLIGNRRARTPSPYACCGRSGTLPHTALFSEDQAWIPGPCGTPRPTCLKPSRGRLPGERVTGARPTVPLCWDESLEPH